MTLITTSATEILTDLSALFTGIYFWSNAAIPLRTDTATSGSDGTKNLLLEMTTGYTKTISNGILTITGSIPLATEWAKSTIASTSTTTSLVLTSASGFSIRDKIVVEISGNFQKVTVTNKVSNTLTVSPALTSAPPNTTPVKVLCCQAGIKKNTAAGLHSIYQDDGFFKQAGVAVPFSFSIPLLGA